MSAMLKAVAEHKGRRNNLRLQGEATGAMHDSRVALVVTHPISTLLGPSTTR